jgi:hypothetical protein
VTYPNVARWDSKARKSVGKRVTAMSRVGLRALQLREGLDEDFIYVHPFETLKSCTFFDHFYLFVFKAIFVNVLILVYAVKKIKNMGVKYLQDTNFSQLSLCEKIGIRNLIVQLLI